MHRPLRMAAHFLTLAAALATIAVVFAPASQSGSPYVSALSDIAATPALAANPHCRSFCEFVPPAFTCLHEGSGTRCGKSSTGGCVTITC